MDILADAGGADLRNSSFDVALRCAQPPLPGCDFRPLLRNELVVVVGAGVADELDSDENGLPKKLPVIADNAGPADYHRWLQHAGVRSRADTVVHHYAPHAMAVQAALDGAGLMPEQRRSAIIKFPTDNGHHRPHVLYGKAGHHRIITNKVSGQ